MIYLDYAATTPMSDVAIEVYTEVAKKYYGNSISLHNIGSVATELLTTSRAQLAQLIGGKTEGVYFTSGGSDSNQLALESLIRGQMEKGNHIITSQIEHSSIQHFLEEKERQGFEVTYLPVDERGRVHLKDVQQAIKETTILTTIHYGNGELGTIQSIRDIGQLLAEHQIVFHSDCCQTFGKIPINMNELPIDSISISSPKVYGPKGVGAVYIRPDIRWAPMYPGTTHEEGFKAGTVNVPGICAFVASAKQVIDDMIEERHRLEQLRHYFITRLDELPTDVVVEGCPESHLPHIMALRVKGIEGQYTMLELNRLGVAISTGSACLVGLSDPPRVMKALGLGDREAKQYVRLSTGKYTTKEEIDDTIEIFVKVLDHFFAQMRV